MKPGDTVWIIESNTNIRSATLMRINGNLTLIKFENGGGIQIPMKRLFHSENEARKALKIVHFSDRQNEFRTKDEKSSAYRTYMYDSQENF